MSSHAFMVVAPQGKTLTVAPLDAGTLVDVEVSYAFAKPAGLFNASGRDGLLARLGADEKGEGCGLLLKGYEVTAMYEAFEQETVGITINGLEVLPPDFPLSWLLCKIPYAYGPTPKSLKLDCNGQGASVRVTTTSAIPLVLTFRYRAEVSPYLDCPYRYHVHGIPVAVESVGKAPVPPAPEPPPAASDLVRIYPYFLPKCEALTLRGEVYDPAGAPSHSQRIVLVQGESGVDVPLPPGHTLYLQIESGKGQIIAIDYEFCAYALRDGEDPPKMEDTGSSHRLDLRTFESIEVATGGEVRRIEIRQKFV